MNIELTPFNFINSRQTTLKVYLPEIFLVWTDFGKPINLDPWFMIQSSLKNSFKFAEML
jgi:hypothetical protein